MENEQPKAPMTAEQKDVASKRACNKIREVFADCITNYPKGKKNKEVLDWSNDDAVINEFTDEWTWYMQGTLDASQEMARSVAEKDAEILKWQQDYSDLQTSKIELRNELQSVKQAAENIAAVLESVTLMKPDTGRYGCTYGDTEYDSASAVYGSNQTLEYIQKRCVPALTAWNAAKEGGSNETN